MNTTSCNSLEMNLLESSLDMGRLVFVAFVPGFELGVVVVVVFVAAVVFVPEFEVVAAVVVAAAAFVPEFVGLQSNGRY